VCVKAATTFRKLLSAAASIQADRWMLFDNSGDNPGMLDRGGLNPRSMQTARDSDLRKATEALIRAGQRARTLARQPRTAVITWKDGKVVRTYPHREGDGQAESLDIDRS
jgi:hypothetical protein